MSSKRCLSFSFLVSRRLYCTASLAEGGAPFMRQGKEKKNKRNAEEISRIDMASLWGRFRERQATEP